MVQTIYNIKNFNILLFTHEFNRKHYQTLKAKHSGKENGLKYCILGVNGLLLFNEWSTLGENCLKSCREPFRAYFKKTQKMKANPSTC